VVEEYDVEQDALMQKIGAKAAELGITAELSTEQKVRKIHEFVRGNIPYLQNSQSHTGSDRSKWETNWVKEASLTLESLSGDCYSNYSLSKAFFEYFGIENVGIKRSTASKQEGTHFWSIVNIGTEKDPQWYYYDSTDLAGRFTADGPENDNACLMTQKRMDSYVAGNGDTNSEFYLMDKTVKYPTVSTKPLS
jgi:hypothetical protein